MLVDLPSVGLMLPFTLRARLERAFGANLTTVRIRTASLPGRLGVTALCCGEELIFAPGVYDPGSSAGARVIAHEVVHVLQQRAGRAQGEGLVVDPVLEAEAEALADLALRGFSAPVPGAADKPPTREARVAQPYDVVANGALGGLHINLNNVTFPGQENGLVHLTKTDPETFLLDDGRVNVVNTLHTAVNLRLSDDGQMAIEDTVVANRQAKNFFATSSVIKSSNSALKKCGSNYRLRKVGTGNQFMLIGPPARNGCLAFFGFGPRRLYQVEAASAATGIGVGTVAANCNQVADDVMGEGRDAKRTIKLKSGGGNNRFPKWKLGGWAPGPNAAEGDIPLRMAAFVNAYLYNNHDRTAALTAATTGYTNGIQTALTGLVTQDTQMAAIVAWCGAIGNDYGSIARDARAAQALTLHGVTVAGGVLQTDYNNLIHSLGINAYADARIGEAFQTYSCGGAVRYTDPQGRRWLRMHDECVQNPPGWVEPVWEYHWGGVIAQSGQDRVTFENYARNFEDKDAPHAPVQEARGYFQMTRVPSQQNDAKLAQSWHESSYRVGFANAMTMSMARRSKCGR